MHVMDFASPTLIRSHSQIGSLTMLSQWALHLSYHKEVKLHFFHFYIASSLRKCSTWMTFRPSSGRSDFANMR